MSARRSLALGEGGGESLGDGGVVGPPVSSSAATAVASISFRSRTMWMARVVASVAALMSSW